MERCGSEANVDSGTLDTQSRKFGIGRGVEVLRMVETLAVIVESETAGGRDGTTSDGKIKSKRFEAAAESVHTQRRKLAMRRPTSIA